MNLPPWVNFVIIIKTKNSHNNVIYISKCGDTWFENMYSQENRIKCDQIPQNSHYPAIILKFACMSTTK